MTYREARYVLAHPGDYDDRTYLLAMEVANAHERQCPGCKACSE